MQLHAIVHSPYLLFVSIPLFLLSGFAKSLLFTLIILATLCILALLTLFCANFFFALFTLSAARVKFKNKQQLRGAETEKEKNRQNNNKNNTV
jgi:hypothetical protein